MIRRSLSSEAGVTSFTHVVGCLWLGIAVLSALGLWQPLTFWPVLLIQLIYKGTWLLVVALPAIRSGESYPSGMAGTFLLWVLALPFLISWEYFFLDCFLKNRR